MSSTVVPYVTLQPDYAEVFDDVATARLPVETAWLSAYAVNAPQASIHAKLRLEPDAKHEGGGVVVSMADVMGNKPPLQIARVRGSQLDLDVESFSTLSHSAQGHSSARSIQNALHVPRTRLRLPRWRLASGITGPLGITGFDVAESPKRRYVAGGADGQLLVSNLEGGAAAAEEDNVRATVKLEGHVGDIRSARFFPSGEGEQGSMINLRPILETDHPAIPWPPSPPVIFSTSSDMTARIFSAVDGSNPRTFKGHKRAILDSAIVGRGREVLTCSADGTVRLWDVAADRQKTVLGAEGYSAVNALSFDSKHCSHDGEAQQQDTLALGLSSGAIQIYDLRTRTPALLIPPQPFPLGPPPAASDRWTQTDGKAIVCLDRLPDRNLLLTGKADGVAALHDLRSPSSGYASSAPLASWRRNGATVTDIAFLPSQSDRGLEFVACAADGLTYRASLEGQLLQPDTPSELCGPKLIEEYVGFDVESASCVRFDAKSRLILAGSGGAVYRY